MYLNKLWSLLPNFLLPSFYINSNYINLGYFIIAREIMLCNLASEFNLFVTDLHKHFDNFFFS